MNAALQPTDDWTGIFPNVPADEYHGRSLDVASASGMKHILRSPAHFHYWATHPEDDKQSPALTFGRALHMAVLEPDTFGRVYSVLPADAPRRPTQAQWNAKKSSPESESAKTWWREWQDANAGKLMLSADDYDRAQRMGDSARAHPIAAGLVTGGDRETTFRWIDPDSGLRCKSRADLYAAGEFVMDVKSCRDASPDGFARAVASYQYDLQAAHYIEGVKATAAPLRWFIFLAIESEAPYVCNPCFLDPKAEERGYLLVQRAMKRQAECLRTGRWGGYSDNLTEIRLPTWAHYATEESA